MKEIPYLDMGKFEFESSRSSETNEFIVLVFCNLSAFIFFSLIFKSIVFPYYDDYDVTIEFPMRYYAYNVSSFVFILCQVVCVYFGTFVGSYIHILLISIINYFACLFYSCSMRSELYYWWRICLSRYRELWWGWRDCRSWMGHCRFGHNVKWIKTILYG